MKKIKIMLTAITVLAVVGGALAFKAQKFGLNYCIATPHQANDACTTSFTGKIDNVVGIAKYAIATDDPTQCNGLRQCTNTLKVTDKE